MTITTIADGTTVQSAQDGPPSDVYVLTGSSTLVMAGSGIVFASNTGESTIYSTGISAQPGGYSGDLIVLGSAHATVLIGGIGSEIFGGSGSADVFFQAPATLVTGSGDLQVIGNPTGMGISYTGGVHDVQQFNGGSIVHENGGAQVILWAAGPTA